MKNDPGSYRTWIEIDGKAFNQNVTALRQLVEPATSMGVVVKSNAYGHGLEVVARLCQDHPGISWLFTAGVQEAVRLRQTGVTKPVLAMAYLDGAPSLLAQYDIAAGIGDMQTAERIAAEGKPVRVHIKVDTGMSRLGFQLPTFEQDMYALAQLPFLSYEGIFTHLSDTNNPDLSFTYQQRDLLSKMAARAERVLCKKLQAHSSASGTLMLPDQQDIVRIGTNIYGHWKSPLQKQRLRNKVPDLDLVPIIAWKTRVMHVKTLQGGDAVGYNRTYVAPQTMRVALLPVGYADGYPRALSHKASVIIRGQRAPVVGLVSMSLLEIDVSGIPAAQEGDEVLLCGNIAGLTPDDLATMTDSVANEFLARISPAIPRVLDAFSA